jgi:hypothetical protein
MYYGLIIVSIPASPYLGTSAVFVRLIIARTAKKKREVGMYLLILLQNHRMISLRGIQ